MDIGFWSIVMLLLTLTVPASIYLFMLGSAWVIKRTCNNSALFDRLIAEW